MWSDVLYLYNVEIPLAMRHTGWVTHKKVDKEQISALTPTKESTSLAIIKQLFSDTALLKHLGK